MGNNSSGLLKDLPKPLHDRDGWPWNKEVSTDLYKGGGPWPKFSVVIPSYNHGNYLEETIRSVLLQNYPEIELIIMDGGSDDNTHEILESYDPWIACWESEEDRGQSHAINKGFKMISGEITCWINSDDFYKQNAFFTAGSIFVNKPDVSLVIGDCDNIYPDNSVKTFVAAAFDPYDFISRISIHQPSTFWKSAVFEKIGMIDESLYMCMDYDLWMRIVFNYNIEIINKSLSMFRRYPEAKSSNFEDQTRVYLDYRKVVCRFFTTVNPDAIPLLKQAGLFENEEMITYPIDRTFDGVTLKKMLHAYIKSCTIQEYILGKVGRVNRLLKYNLNKDNLGMAILYLLKNNLGVRKLFHPYRKY